jgi:hypothetical protein
VTFLAALVNVCRGRKDYALFEVIGDGVDTVGVWGQILRSYQSSPILIRISEPVAPKRSINCSLSV